MAYWTGLRRSELAAITRADVDLERHALRVRRGVSKAKREDWIPLRSDIVDILADTLVQTDDPLSPVFGTIPRIKTFHRDCGRAREAWIDAVPDGAERVRWEESDFLKRFDIEGRQLDLYSLRTTLGTHLARHNTAPQVAQRIIRHVKMQTTIDHYTDLRIADESMAIDSMPAIDIKIKTTTTEADTVQEVSATGTDDVVANWQRIDSEQGAFSGDDGQPVAKCDITGPAGADPCEESQVTYNLVDGDDCRRMATQGVQADENDRKSLKHGPLAQLASAPL